MILVADIGNTSITVGVYQGDKLLSSWRLASDKKRSEDEYGFLSLLILYRSAPPPTNDTELSILSLLLKK